jgi:hypothetical protein
LKYLFHCKSLDLIWIYIIMNRQQKNGFHSTYLQLFKLSQAPYTF